jgi:hypothetical protein
LVAFAFTGSGPVIRQDGPALTVTVFVLVELHPEEFEVVNVRMKVPAVPAVTLIVLVVVDPTIVPLPLMLHA